MVVKVLFLGENLIQCEKGDSVKGKQKEKVLTELPNKEKYFVLGKNVDLHIYLSENGCD